MTRPATGEAREARPALALEGAGRPGTVGRMLALGTAHWGQPYGIGPGHGPIGARDLEKLLDAAQASGIDMLDTAAAHGKSEARIGETRTTGMVIVTKLQPGTSAADARSAIQHQAARLGRSRLDVLLIHRAADTNPDLARALLDCREDGLIGRLGVSIYDPEEVLAVRQAGLPIDVIQCPVSLLDQRMLRGGWLDRWQVEGIEIHARSLFLQGLLLLPPGNRPSSIPDEAGLLARFDRWRTAEAPLARALSIVRALPQVTRFILGIRSADELAGILSVLEASPLPPEAGDLDILDGSGTDLIRPDRWPGL